MVPPPHAEIEVGEKQALARNKAAPGGTELPLSGGTVKPAGRQLGKIPGSEIHFKLSGRFQVPFAKLIHIKIPALSKCLSRAFGH